MPWSTNRSFPCPRKLRRGSRQQLWSTERSGPEIFEILVSKNEARTDGSVLSRWLSLSSLAQSSPNKEYLSGFTRLQGLWRPFTKHGEEVITCGNPTSVRLKVTLPVVSSLYRTAYCLANTAHNVTCQQSLYEVESSRAVSRMADGPAGASGCAHLAKL